MRRRLPLPAIGGNTCDSGLLGKPVSYGFRDNP